MIGPKSSQIHKYQFNTFKVITRRIVNNFKEIVEGIAKRMFGGILKIISKKYICNKILKINFPVEFPQKLRKISIKLAKGFTKTFSGKNPETIPEEIYDEMVQ